RQLAPTVVGVHRETTEVCDAVALVREVERHRAGAPPVAVLLDLDHEAAGLLGLGERALDLLAHGVRVTCAPAAEERFDVVVTRELGEEVGVTEPRAAEPEAVAAELAHRAVTTAVRRLGKRRTPEAIGVPVRIRTRPTIADAVIGSPSRRAP